MNQLDPNHDLVEKIRAAFPRHLTGRVYGCSCCWGDDNEMVERLNTIARDGLSNDDLQAYGSSAIWTLGSYEQWLYFVPTFLERALSGQAHLLETVWYKIGALGLMGETATSRQHARSARRANPPRWTAERAEALQQTIDVAWRKTLSGHRFHAASFLRDITLAGLAPRDYGDWSKVDPETVFYLLEHFDPTDERFHGFASGLGSPSVGELLLEHCERIQPSWRQEHLWFVYSEFAKLNDAEMAGARET